MSVSLGVDIEEVARFKSLIRNKRFLSRVFSKDEINYCNKKKNKFQHFAVRFAAKEAVWKALSAKIKKSGRNVSHKQIYIKNHQTGRPIVHLPPFLSKYKSKIVISLSHTKAYAVAVAHFQG